MRRFIFIVLMCLSLSGCGAWTHQMLTNVSNKNDGSVIQSDKNHTGTASNKQCNQWCHNGWCSTHCETVVNE